MATDQREMIDFYQLNTGVKTKRTGIRVGNHLVVSYSSKYSQPGSVQIFGILSGRPVADVKFKGSEQGIHEAIEMAQWLDRIYADYWDLWYAYPQWNVISISRWTIPDGIRLWLCIDILEKQQRQVDVITLKDLHRAWEAAQLEAPNWTRYVKPR